MPNPLMKKIGKLPVAAWIGIAFAALLLTIYLRRNWTGADASESASPSDLYTLDEYDVGFLPFEQGEGAGMPPDYWGLPDEPRTPVPVIIVDPETGEPIPVPDPDPGTDEPTPAPAPAPAPAPPAPTNPSPAPNCPGDRPFYHHGACRRCRTSGVWTGPGGKKWRWNNTIKKCVRA